jgi:hypothetical protein
LQAAWLLYSLTLKTDIVYSSETSVSCYCPTYCHVTENSTLPSHHCENVKPNTNHSMREGQLTGHKWI